MDPAALEQAIYQAIVELLADRVVDRLRSRRNVALALFTGAEQGIREAVSSLQGWRDVGWTIRAVFSETARRVLSPDSLGEFGSGLSSGEFGASGEMGEMGERALLDGCGVLLVPTLSINSAAKVAAGIRDSLPSRLMAHALERGVPVIAASDGCCPDDPQRIAQGFFVAEAYKAQLRCTLEALQSYGMKLVRAEMLAHAAQRPNATPMPPVRRPGASAQTPRGSGASVGTGQGKRVFGRGDAVQCREGVLRLERGVLVTPLAKDELQRRNVRLIRT